MRNYKIDILTYNKNGSVRSDCADIAFQNNGQVDVLLNNGYRIAAYGGVVSFAANNDELDNTIYTFSFINSAGVYQNNLVVIRKVYI